MSKIGIFFGTNSGTTRLIAKKIAKKLGAVGDKPLNVNRTSIGDMLKYEALILGTPTYGEGQVPGLETGAENGSWAEFLPQLADADFSGKRIALYGLGDQEKYPTRFVDGLFELYTQFSQRGATVVGDWSAEGYTFAHSQALVNGRFVGLVLDQSTQSLLTEPRLDAWLATVTPLLVGDA